MTVTEQPVALRHADSRRLITLRQDRWWLAPLFTVVVLGGFIIYGTYVAFANTDYFVDPYLSPFYSPCLADNCDEPTWNIIGDWWSLSPALLILPVPLGFRLTCYYYRKAYYRSFLRTPPGCAVADARASYSGETRFPLILQNVHRYFFYLALPFPIILLWDALKAFNFDGEFNIANRGLIEFIEVLKLDVAFLYDLLGASQEHKIKPKKFPQTDIDTVIIGHTNEPEYRKLQSNEFMEALRDRTVKIDIPYVTKLSEERKIYEKDYNSKRVRGKHIAPHTLEIAAMWAVLTRLEEPKNAGLTLLQKLKLYNGKTLPGFTTDNVIQLRKEAKQEGMLGISPRYVQDKISNALVANSDSNNLNPFMVMNELESGLKHHSLVQNEELKQHYKQLISVVKDEYTDVVKNEVQRAIAADEEALTRLCGNYIDNVKAYTQKERVKNKFTGEDEEPDERLMRSIEERIDIPESRKDDFRREIMNYIGALSLDGKKFDYRTNERLHKALELKLFEDQKDTIKLTSLVSSVVDQETQQKIDVVKGRLIRDFGYDDESATDVLHYVASIFARGDVKD